MPNPIDLSGKTFGKLKVDRLSDERGKQKQRLWVCECNCGLNGCLRTTIVTAGHLLRGATRSCGCHLFPDLTGKRFGKLIVAERLNQRTAAAKRRWRCKCDCGKEKIVTGGNLTCGQVTSCGCSRKKPRPDHKERILKSVREKKVIRDERVIWYSPRRAAKYAEVDENTLRRWKAKCYWLGGKGIGIKSFPGVLNRSTVYYLKTDLDKIRKARGQHPNIPQILGYEHIDEAVAQLDCHEKCDQKKLRARMKEVNDEAGHNYTIKKFTGKTRNEHHRPVHLSYVPIGFINHEKRRLGIEDTLPTPDQLGESTDSAINSANNATPQSTGGRNLDPMTTALEHFCWKHREKKPAATMERAGKYFGEGVISDVRRIKTFRDRFEGKIKKYGLPALMELIKDVWVLNPAFA